MKVLGCAGHVERMGPERRPKRLRDCQLEGPKLSGGQHETHHQTVEECIGRKGISEWRKLAATKTDWRKAIRTPILLRARTSVKHQTKFIDRWAEAPDSIIGRSVEKKFGSKWHVGKIVSTELDIDTNETIWHVKYDDSDSEDFGAREIEVAMLETDEEGSSSDEGASYSASPHHQTSRYNIFLVQNSMRILNETSSIGMQRAASWPKGILRDFFSSRHSNSFCIVS